MFHHLLFLAAVSAALLAGSASAQPALLSIAATPPAVHSPAKQARISMEGVHAAAFNADVGFALPAGSEIPIELPRSLRYRVVHDRVEQHASGSRTWIGHLADRGTDFRVLITQGPDGSYGRILTPDGEFILETDSHGQWLYDLERAPLKKAIPSQASDARLPPAMEKAPPVAESSAATDKALSAPSVVDIMVIYTQSMVSRLGSVANVLTRVDHLIALSNQAYIDSQIHLALRVVKTQQVGYSDTTSDDQALYDVTGNNGSGAVAIPSSLQNVATWRDTYGADVVVLMRSYSDFYQQGTCGIAWITVSHYGSNPSFAYAVVSDGFDGNVGCGEYTFTHEIGHVFGAWHDRITENYASGGSNPSMVYPYAFGHGVSGSFETIMGYASSFKGAPTLGVFSNPSITCKGVPCGVAVGDPSHQDADNALVLENTRATVANYRASATTVNSRVSTDFNGDGKSDILWRRAADGYVTMWLMSGASSIATAGVYADPAWTIAGTGDFNGDGKTDLLWRRASDGYVTLWLMNGAASIGSAGLYADPAWTVLATGDFNGDGKTDILWRRASDGYVTMWLMNGLAPVISAGVYASPAWTVVATGDFNGDGKTDILWRRASDGYVTMWLMNGASAIGQAGLYADPAWTVIGTGDFNGDGKSDILWRRAADGLVTLWLMNGTSIVGQASLYADPAWTIVGTGDFNGDGKSDILWRRASDGYVTVWFMNGLAPVSGAGLYADPAWTPVGMTP